MKAPVLRVAFPASYGELIQGRTEGGPFLTSYAINRYNLFCFSFKPASISGPSGAYRVTRFSQASRPSWFFQSSRASHAAPLIPRPLEAKAQHLLTLVRDHLGEGCLAWDRLVIARERALPTEKGLGSSTADLAAIAYGVYALAGRTLLPEILARLATTVEPTDSLVYPALTLMNPMTGQSLAHFKQTRYDAVVGLELADRVNTVALHREIDKYPWDQGAHKTLYQQTLAAFGAGSLDRVLALAGESARLNQAVLTKPHLEVFLSLQAIDGVVGVNVSHSGSVVGIIYRRGKVSREALIRRIRHIDASGLYRIYDYQMVAARPVLTWVRGAGSPGSA